MASISPTNRVLMILGFFVPYLPFCSYVSHLFYNISFKKFLLIILIRIVYATAISVASAISIFYENPGLLFVIIPIGFILYI